MIRKRRESTILSVCQVDFFAKIWYNKRIGHFLIAHERKLYEKSICNR